MSYATFAGERFCFDTTYLGSDIHLFGLTGD
jgi:hypothetical protein